MQADQEYHPAPPNSLLYPSRLQGSEMKKMTNDVDIETNRSGDLGRIISQYSNFVLSIASQGPEA